MQTLYSFFLRRIISCFLICQQFVGILSHINSYFNSSEINMMENENSTKYIICSKCFKDTGLQKEAEQLGVKKQLPCPICGKIDGAKLDKNELEEVCNRFFLKGSFYRTLFGGSRNLNVYFENSKQDDMICTSSLLADMNLLKEKFGIAIGWYGPQMWKVGFNDWMETLESANHKKRNATIEDIIQRCSNFYLSKNDYFYRIRTNLCDEELLSQTYDAPIRQNLQSGRFNINSKSVFYGSFNIETCIHETRVTIDDDIYIATFHSTMELKLLDFTRVLKKGEEITPFEDLSTALSMIFYAGKQSYKITQAFSLIAMERGYDGIIYPSFYNQVRDEDCRNLILFGRPVLEGKLEMTSVNHLVLNKVEYEYTLGPVLARQNEP